MSKIIDKTISLEFELSTNNPNCIISKLQPEISQSI